MSDLTRAARRALDDFTRASLHGRSPSPWGLARWVGILTRELDRREAEPAPEHFDAQQQEVAPQPVRTSEQGQATSATESDVIAEVKRRLVGEGYADADRVRAALLHIEAFEQGRARTAPGLLNG